MTAPISSQTVLALLRRAESILSENDIDNPSADAREITAAALGCPPSALRRHYEEEAPDSVSSEVHRMLSLRIKGEPIQYVIGSWSFMGRDYKVGAGVLIPRDDTEVVVSEALRLIRDLQSPRVIDLCSGSGVIAVTIKKERPDAKVCAVEKSPEACAYLRLNTARNSADITVCERDIFDLYRELDDNTFDLIVSNPPYIRSSEIATLQKEVQFEPRMALDGGESGFDFYEKIIDLWTTKLAPGGFIAFEIGEDQFDRIAALLKAHGYTEIKGYPDIQGVTRAVTAHRNI